MGQIAQSPRSFASSSPTQSTRRSPVYLPLDLLRYVLRKVLLVAVTVITQAWRHPVIALALAVTLGVGYQQFIRDSASAEPAEAAITDLRTSYIEPAPSVLAYLEAQRAGDAEATWATYSEVWKGALLQRGETPDTTRQLFEDARAAGAEFGESAFIGAREQANGETVYVFSTPQNLPGGDSPDFIQVFHVGADGLISQRLAIVSIELQQDLQQ